MTLVGAEGLQRRLRAIGSREGQRAMMGALGRETQRRAKSNTRAFRKTGDLGRSIELGRVTDDSVTVEARSAHAAATELGSRPHIIRARRAKALRFATTAGREAGLTRKTGSIRRISKAKHAAAVESGLIRFARSVRHPGTKPQPYLVPAARSTLRDSGIARDSIIARWNAAD